MQPDVFSTSSNSSDHEEARIAVSAAPIIDPESGPSSAENQNERDLSQEEVDKLVQLQDLTGIDDLQICRALLESKDWDLEATAREQFDPQDSGQPAHNQRLEPHDEAPESSIYQNILQSPRIIPERNLDHGIHQANSLFAEGSHPRSHIRSLGASTSSNSRLPFPVHRDTNWGAFGILRWGFYLITLPFAWPARLAYNTVTNIFDFISDLLGLGHLFHLGQGTQRGRRFLPRPPVTDPRGDVVRFRERLEQQYGSIHPPLYDATYSQALEKAKQDLRFLLVYLHCPSHQDTDEFCKSVICSPELTNFASEQNVIFWACSVDSGEGYRVSEALHESTYPFMAVIVLRQNRMMIVGRLEGAPPNPVMIAERLNNVVRDNEAFIVAARADRAERHMNQTIREEQDAALQDALKQDQEKERKKKEVEDKKKRDDEEEETRAKEEQNRKEKIAKAKIDCAESIPPEPGKSETGVIRIVIKLPEGQRLERRFLKTDSLKYLYYYVFCHPESPDDFDITTNFPRRVLNCKPRNLMKDLELSDASTIDQINVELEEDPPTFEAAGIGQSTMLFVNDLEA